MKTRQQTQKEKNGKMGMKYEYRGTVHKVGGEQKFPSGFYKRELVCVTNPAAQWPDYAVFEFMKEASKKLELVEEGDRVCVQFYLSAMESRKNPGSWFSSNRGVEISVEEKAAPRSAPEIPDAPEPPADIAESGDLPF